MNGKREGNRQQQLGWSLPEILFVARHETGLTSAQFKRDLFAATGLLCGVIAALLMILLMAGARTWLGISPPPEALPDRFAPTIPTSLPTRWPLIC